jgi:hypothetical protein
VPAVPNVAVTILLVAELPVGTNVAAMAEAPSQSPLVLPVANTTVSSVAKSEPAMVTLCAVVASVVPVLGLSVVAAGAARASTSMSASRRVYQRAGERIGTVHVQPGQTGRQEVVCCHERTAPQQSDNK